MNPAVMKPDILQKINDKVMQFNANQNMLINPKLHIGLNPLYLQIRHEVNVIAQNNIKARKKKIRELLVQDFLQEDKELRQVGLAYMNTQP